MKPFVRQLLFSLVFWLAAGCATQEDDITIEAPEFPTGPGIAYPVKDVTFTTVDNVEVSARYSHPDVPGPNPVVILVHDIGELSAFIGGLEWLFAGLFERLLEEGYSPLAIDLRGHGNTPYPDDGRTEQILLVSDLDHFHLDVRAALNWLKSEPSADIARVAIVGAGVGGNVAFVSMGAFPDDLQAGVALSPGIFDYFTGKPFAVGEEVEDFSPHSMMFIVAENDIRQITDDGFLIYPDYASDLKNSTDDPTDLKLVPDELQEYQVYDGRVLYKGRVVYESRVVYVSQAADGLDLLENPEVVDALLSWLEKNL